MEDAEVTATRHFNPRSPHGERLVRLALSQWLSENFNPRSPHGERRRPSCDAHQGCEISIHAPRTGSDPRLRNLRTCPSYFNPRSPHGERLPAPLRICSVLRISIHAPRTGSDAIGGRGSNRNASFQSTLPARGATTHGSGRAAALAAFQSTLPARGATSEPTVVEKCVQNFNPRSPHGERPSAAAVHASDGRFQSTLPARGATAKESSSNLYKVFQSTLPARGATLRAFAADTQPDNFNPRSPHGERRQKMQSGCARHIISIHAPRTGSDRTSPALCHWRCRFQSTLPARGATVVLPLPVPAAEDFNPRSPHGERRTNAIKRLNHTNISIHAPRTGSDLARRRLRRPCSINFNPRSPHGERLDGVNQRVPFVGISIHAPRTGSDDETMSDQRELLRISIHAPRTGSDRWR